MSDTSKWTPERFIEAFTSREPKAMQAIIGEAMQAGLAAKAAGRLIAALRAEGRLYEHRRPGTNQLFLATVKP